MATLEQVNDRLKRGEGWIGFRNVGRNPDGTTKRSKTLYYSFYRNGKQLFVKTDTADPEQAYVELLNARGQVKRGTLVLPSEAAKITYEILKQKYIDVDENRKNAKWAPLDEFFSGMRATQITADTLQKYINHRRDEGIADPTIRRELVVLRAMFWRAVEDKELSHDQMPFFRMPKDSDGAAQYIDPAAFALIRKQLPAGAERVGKKGGPKSETNLQPFFTFLYATSCRLGVAEIIPWKWVDKNCTVISVPPGVTKNNEALTISLKGALLAPIREWMLKQFRNPDALVFDSTNFRPEWSKAVARAGFGTWKNRRRTGFRIHDCRASAAINLLDAGVPESTVMQIGGWKNRKMLDRYAKLTGRRAHAAMEAAGNYVHQLMVAEGTGSQ